MSTAAEASADLGRGLVLFFICLLGSILNPLVFAFVYRRRKQFKYGNNVNHFMILTNLFFADFCMCTINGVGFLIAGLTLQIPSLFCKIQGCLAVVFACLSVVLLAESITGMA